MNLNERINVFSKLGDVLRGDFFDKYSDFILKAELNNPFFTSLQINKSIEYWGKNLIFDNLESWIKPYNIHDLQIKKRILLVMAGNIPLVGFHDLLSVLICGHKVVVKMSRKDNILIFLFLDILFSIDRRFKHYVKLIEDINEKEFDALICTGNDNTAKYFEYYFRNIKKIIRNNRTSIAIIDGLENTKQLKDLSNDILSYFGLGCRNVSKLFIPKDYDLNNIFNALYHYNDILINHQKYMNNYDYNRSVLLMGSQQFLDNGFLLLKNDSSLFSPVSMLYYEYYSDTEHVSEYINTHSDKIQCVVSSKDILFGESQNPTLWSYADNVDTIDFLRSI